jgi:hypothetical protein
MKNKVMALDEIYYCCINFISIEFIRMKYDFKKICCIEKKKLHPLFEHQN